MHPSQTLVPRLSALISRAARRQPARLIPPAAVVAVQVSVHHVIPFSSTTSPTLPPSLLVSLPLCAACRLLCPVPLCRCAAVSRRVRANPTRPAITQHGAPHTPPASTAHLRLRPTPD
ncbi:hypothetical protein CC85DRAFT_119876 [Cutaneotrichosporon oleaginosum]|uniref:Uncharacterized protein n=1 Tax=Cutaneotrichosporon oleaginosum TaxID=879819 RepID=A0A0J0XK70_9TREE|nr:uncharacterized protein CC85DRAFT_119876 [Cutaneotrichosporon oleaginosum]KLT41503.1 hypothetical protein CC85DRAFT_119876 [Cutaneotrichosporon oleaginosum]TXT05848.1 hypothetical protein COLE_07168 [Cutaneotrichosporon oleaginosum]